ncbi:MAG: ThuA domain-containing protein [Chloroflexi bacterium]|nr:ThuA domain-containing protein [Chloroflexota bacterium]
MVKALIVCGGWLGHEPVETGQIAAQQLRSGGFAVEIADSLDVFLDWEKLLSLDLIVPVWTMGSIRREQVQPLLTAVRSGVGLGGWHGGMGDAFREATDYQFMTGGQWVAHPGNDGVRYKVRIGPHAHPITAGLSDFWVTSEQYFMHVDPAVTVLAESYVAEGAASGDPFAQAEQDAVDRGDQQGVAMPVVWIKRFGRGRVFYVSLGHKAKVFDIPEALTLMRRGLVWAAQGKGLAAQPAT